MDTQRQKSRAAAISVISNTGLVLVKLVVGVLIGSISVVSEAIHSAVDLVASVIAFVAVKTSGKPADADHPFGHTKVEDVSAGAEALLIFVAAVWIIYEAFQKLLSPEPLKMAGWGFAVMLVSAVANVGVSQFLFRVGKSTASPALMADAWHLRTDVYTSGGVMVGLGLITLGGWLLPAVNLAWLDPLAAIAVAALILRAAYRLTKGSVRELVDTSLPEDEVKWLYEYLCTLRPVVRAFHRVRTRKAGALRFIDLHLLVDATMTVKESHDITERVSKDVEAKLPGANVTVHIEPCEADCTPRCNVDCLLNGEEKESLRAEKRGK